MNRHINIHIHKYRHNKITFYFGSKLSNDNEKGFEPVNKTVSPN